MQSPLEEALSAQAPAEREAALGEACSRAAKLHNELEITEALDPGLRPFFDRPYRVLGAQQVTSYLRRMYG